MDACWSRHTLHFLFEARTSRESMRLRDTYIIRLKDTGSGRMAYGEANLFPGLSAEPADGFSDRLSKSLASLDVLPDESAIRFGIESAQQALAQTAGDTPFLRGEQGIPINGLVWMGDKDLMRIRIEEKLKAGFRVVKLKIGGIAFEDELDLLRHIRRQFTSADLEIRLDANGSFSPADAIKRLERLAPLNIHSIEQPIKAGQWDVMADLCRRSPIDIALDEELIGVTTDRHEALLRTIKPRYIILKPALCGGLSGADHWADTADALGIGWWATSALESNVGLEAIARWVSRRGVTMPQGLGTGLLYSNNFASPLELRGDMLYYNPEKSPVKPQLQWHR